MILKSAHKKFFKGFTTKSLHLRGFTLIELLIVIAILGILAAAVLVAINPAKRTRQARDAARKNDIGSLATEVQAYYTTPGQGVYFSGSGCPGGMTVLTVSGGLKQMPAGPQGDNYCYTVDSNTAEVAVYSTVEDPTTSGGNVWWCWRSADNAARERTTAQCIP